MAHLREIGREGVREGGREEEEETRTRKNNRSERMGNTSAKRTKREVYVCVRERDRRSVRVCVRKREEWGEWHKNKSY